MPKTKTPTDYDTSGHAVATAQAPVTPQEAWNKIISKPNVTRTSTVTAAPAPADPAAETFAQLPLAAIVSSLTNPRKTFHAERLQELAESIQASGVHQPILVRPLPGDRVLETPREVTHEIVAGERRYRASVLAGAPTIPALIRPLTDAQALEIQLVENLQRDDLTVLEEAEGYELLRATTGISAEDLATKIGRSKRYVFNRLKLLDLCQAGKDALRAGHIDASRALLIATIPSATQQQKALKEAQAVSSYNSEPVHSLKSDRKSVV